MNKTFLFILFVLEFFLVPLITDNVYAADKEIPFKKETEDDLNNKVSHCANDKERFEVLSKFFWKYIEKDFERAKYIGNWAYEVSLKSKSSKVLADGCNIKGIILEKDEKYDSAYVSFLLALSISKKIGYPQLTFSCYYRLAKINDVLGHADSTYFYLKTLYNFNFKNEDFGSACWILSEIASTFEKHDLPDSAMSYYRQLLNLSIQIKDNNYEMAAYFDIINLNKKQNNTKIALGYMNEALKLAEKNKDINALSSIYYQIGDLFFKQKKNYDIALTYYQKSLEICDTADKYQELSILNTISNLYLEEAKDNLALPYIQKGLKLSHERKFKQQESEAYRNLGIINKHKGKLQESIENFETGYTIGYEQGQKIILHSTLIEIADLYLELKNHKKALEYYNKSLELATNFNAKAELSVSNLKIGNYYRFQDGRLAEKYYLKAIPLAQQSKNIVLIKSVADTLSRLYINKNNFKTACQFQILSMAMADSISKIDKQASMADWELKFEFERLTKANEAREQFSNEEIKRQKIFRNGAFLVSAFLIVLGFVVFGSYKRKKKDNKLLTRQKNEIERISRELHESDEMKLRFFSNISHEFRTPLTLIINPAENLLKTFPGNNENKKQLEHIYKNAHKLLDLTNQVMDLQKLEAGKLELRPEKADIVEYCLGIASSFESLCRKKNNVIKFTTNHRAVIALFDKDKIGKVITNLMSNAFKYCYINSTIEVNIELLENRFNMSVTDKGVGISSKQIDNVFKRYYQIPSGNQVSGTGIGMAYVKELAGLMKGEVSIDSIEKTGTKVNIAIPLEEYTINDASVYRIEIPNTDRRPNGKEFDMAELVKDDQSDNTVLLVEDNDELRTFIAGLLKTDFNIRLANDGLEGLQAAYQHIPDIIISDVMMPGMDGFELCAALKKDERTSHIPVILLTAMDSTQSSLEGYQTGADDYIIKPFDNELLKLKVKNIIATREAARKQFDFKSILSIDGPKIGDTDKGFMRKCLNVIEKHIKNSEFAVDTLAEEMAFSNRNFYRKIKALTNQTPAELIRGYRLHYAKQLLQNTKMKVFEIALAVGYEDTNKFRQAFKKQFGVSPSESVKETID